MIIDISMNEQEYEEFTITGIHRFTGQAVMDTKTQGDSMACPGGQQCGSCGSCCPEGATRCGNCGAKL